MIADAGRPSTSLRSSTSSPPSGPKRIALWGNFGVGNLGNECTLQAIVSGIRRHQPDARLCCVCREPADTLKRHRIPAFPMAAARPRPDGIVVRTWLTRRLYFLATEAVSLFAALATTWRNDSLIVAGTGILNDQGEGPLGLPWQIFKWSLAAALTRTRLMFVCVGAEQLDSRLSRFFIGTSLRLAHYRSYRDALSRERLLRMGCPVADDPVYPDLAFSLELPPARPADAVRGVVIGLYDLLRADASEPGRTVEPAYLDKLCTLTKRLLDCGEPVRWVIGDLRYDVPVLEELGQEFARQEPGRAPGAEPALTVDDLLAQLAEADVAVVTRFHNMLLSLLLGRPVVSISYEAKSDVLMAEMGLVDYCQPIERFEVDRVMAQVQELRRDKARLSSAILRRASEYRQDLERQYRAILG